MNQFLNVRTPVLNKWRVQFHFSCKISVEFGASSFYLGFGNVKFILNNPNPTSSLWLLPGKNVYFNVSILTLFVSIFIEYLYFAWLPFHDNLITRIRRSEFFIDNFRAFSFNCCLTDQLCRVRIIKTFAVFLHRSSWELIAVNQK